MIKKPHFYSAIKSSNAIIYTGTEIYQLHDAHFRHNRIIGLGL